MKIILKKIWVSPPPLIKDKNISQQEIKINKILDSCKCTEQIDFCENAVENVLNTIENINIKKEMRSKFNRLIQNKRIELN